MQAKFVNEENIYGRKTYHRLSNKTIGNNLYSVMKDLESLFETLERGYDLNIIKLDSIIEELQNIRESAKEFKVERKPSKDYK